MEDKRKQWIDAMCKIVTSVLDMKTIITANIP